MKVIGKILALTASFGALVAVLLNYGIVKLKHKRKMSFVEKVFGAVSISLRRIFMPRPLSPQKRVLNTLHLSSFPFFSR